MLKIQRQSADTKDKDFDEPILPLGYLALFSTRLIIDFKAIANDDSSSLSDVKFDAGTSIA
jgi:hypothetical protein